MNEEIKSVQQSNEENGAEFDFMAEVEKTFPAKIYQGKRVKVIVEKVGKHDIIVDLGTKHSGYIPVDEVIDSDDPETIVKPGDEIDCIVIKVNDAEGYVYLSTKPINAEIGWGVLTSAFDNGEILDALHKIDVNVAGLGNIEVSQAGSDDCATTISIGGRYLSAFEFKEALGLKSTMITEIKRGAGEYIFIGFGEN